MLDEYLEFLKNKSHAPMMYGIPEAKQWIPNELFDFQKHLVSWSIARGRSALFCDCGLGKTFMELVFAQNIVNHTGKKMLIVAPLAVSC